MPPLDPASLYAAHGIVGILAFGAGVFALWLLLMVACYILMLWPAAWTYKTVLRVGSRMLGYPLAIPADSFNFTFMSGFAGWAALCLITLAFGAMQGQAGPVMPTKMLVILLVMAAGPAVYAIGRGYLNQNPPTTPGVA
jgi:hypothetical protein